ncbi:MAG: type I glutamate--ammonia ligase [Deltaproteobacteria bacterium]|jgi:glutamine synthetase|nr:type I glutamate--ammonia ligase [Deltaproteobacteria bacterium]
MKIQDILSKCKKENVRYLRLQFSDIMGMNKNVEVPSSQFQKALEGNIFFDGSSIDGFARIEESDMKLKPDLSTFDILPWKNKEYGQEARVVCDIYTPDDTPFAGCTRYRLRQMLKKAQKMNYCLMVGPEIEFFLFHRNDDGEITTNTHDTGGYFDLTPVDKGEFTRRKIVEDLEKMGFEIEASHHEVASAQHEIDFKYVNALSAADKISTFRFLVRKTSLDHNLHATFMPKPIFGEAGSGMHTNQSLFQGNQNIFYGKNEKYGLSKTAMYYMGGLLKHAKAITAVTNPLVNSYKRLVPGFEAPVTIAWAKQNRSPLIRVPGSTGQSTRIEMRNPDPACNPYLAIACMLAAGLDGIINKIDPGEPAQENIFDLKNNSLQYEKLPANLEEAIEALEKSKLMKTVLGEHIFENYIRAKKSEWKKYSSQVHDWEIQKYLNRY